MLAQAKPRSDCPNVHASSDYQYLCVCYGAFLCDLSQGILLELYNFRL